MAALSRVKTGRSVAKRGRPQLEPAVIVEAALRCLDEEGLEGLTMRRLATELGVENPALYWHVRNKQELLDLMARAVLAKGFAQMGDPPGAWDAQLEWLARGFRKGLLQRRDGARLIASADLGKGEGLRSRVQALGKVLESEGFDPVAAIGGVITLVHYTLGATFEEQAEPAGEKASRTRLAKRFDLGLEIILDGLRARRARSQL